MQLIKFCGKDKKESVKRALSFYYDNFVDDFTRELFMAKCRLQDDKKTIHFYPSLEVDINKYREFKTKKKEKRK